MHIAIDPGKTTGVCVGVWHGDAFNIVLAREVGWNDRFWFREYLFTHRDNIETIIIERFKLFPKRETMLAQINSEFPSVRIIGIVEAYADMFGLFHKIVFQEPNDRNSVRIPKEHHLALGTGDHVKDAYRHLRYYYLTHKS